MKKFFNKIYSEIVDDSKYTNYSRIFFRAFSIIFGIWLFFYFGNITNSILLSFLSLIILLQKKIFLIFLKQKNFSAFFKNILASFEIRIIFLFFTNFFKTKSCFNIYYIMIVIFFDFVMTNIDIISLKKKNFFSFKKKKFFFYFLYLIYGAFNIYENYHNLYIIFFRYVIFSFFTILKFYV